MNFHAQIADHFVAFIIFVCGSMFQYDIDAVRLQLHVVLFFHFGKVCEIRVADLRCVSMFVIAINPVIWNKFDMAIA